MKITELGLKERSILLEALGFDVIHLRCQLCDTWVDFGKCSIMPPVGTKMRATILCESILCMAGYFEKLEGEENDTDGRRHAEGGKTCPVCEGRGTI